MAAIEDPNVAGNVQRVEASGAARITVGLIGDRYSQGNVTGTMAAALAANSTVYAMRLNPGASKLVRIHRVRLHFTTVLGFTVALTAGRRLAIFRGVGAAAGGGTALGVTSERDSASPASQCDVAQGGDQRIATTGALTVTGITFEASPLKVMPLTHCGALGAVMESVFEFDDDTGGPLILRPGELMAIRNPVAMDAVGTWQLAVNVDWTEIADLS